MTRGDHVSGSDRIFEALEALDPEQRIDVVVNVQGDLPTIDPADIGAALKPLDDPAVDIATLAAVITDAGRTAPIRTSSRCRHAGSRPAVCTRFHFHPRNRAIGRRPALPPHRALRLSARGAGALRQTAAVGQRAAREARAAARARRRHAHRRRWSSSSVPLGVDTPEDLEKARAGCSPVDSAL